MVLTQRDGRILEHIHEYDGFLADYQVKELEFTGLRQAQDRLGKLFHNGYLNRTNRYGRASSGAMIYWLTRKGAMHVATSTGVRFEEFVWTKTLPVSLVQHNLLVNDFTLILQQACPLAQYLSLQYWVNESVFRTDPDRVEYVALSGKKASRNLIPDRFFVVARQGKERPFYSRLLLELDVATHPNKRFADHKVLPGLAYLRSETYLRRFGSNTGRWLVVTTSDTRLGFLKETTERVAGSDARTWYFTTFEQVTPETVLTGDIWQPGGSEERVSLFPSRD